MKTKSSKLAVLALLLASGSIAKSQTTTWGTSAFENHVGYFSDGNEGSSNLTWSLGWFTDGFTPTAYNYSEWASNFNLVDSGQETFGFLGYSVIRTKSDVGEAAYGKQAYVFVYNDLGLIGTSAGEALLYTDNGFFFPDIPNAGTFDIDDTEDDPSDDNFTVVWGRLDREIEKEGGVITGNGVFTNVLADSTDRQWEAQTATWAVVPEPSTVILGVFGSFALFLRKRRAV